MQPIDFKGATARFTKPESWTDEECGTLAAVYDRSNGTISSIWEPTEEERQMIAAGHPIVVSLYSHVQPPLAVSVSTIPSEKIVRNT